MLVKNKWVLIIVIAIVIVAVGGYLVIIKAMLGMKSTQPVSRQQSYATPKSSTAAIVPSDNIYKVGSDPVKGKYLTDFQGMTLYAFDKDTPGVSNCYDQCAAAWPVYTSGATAQGTFPENISVITRKDNTKQFAWKGMPLYYFAKDTKSGDINGDSVGGVWHIVKP